MAGEGGWEVGLMCISCDSSVDSHLNRRPCILDLEFGAIGGKKCWYMEFCNGIRKLKGCAGWKGRELIGCFTILIQL